jgi:PhnB protein
MKLNPHLNFNGQCEAAFKFYEQVLGGKITFMMTFGESPAAEHVPPEIHKCIIHATMTIGDDVVMGSDAPPDRYEEPKGIYIALNFRDPAEGERIFQALSENGVVRMPFQQTFWSPGFGMCVDRFGIPWMINCEQELQPSVG